MSDTPETDKIAHAGLPERAYISEMTHKARKLEREREEARKEVERLKAEAELYAGWSKWKNGIWRISHPDSGPSAEWIAEDIEGLKADKARLERALRQAEDCFHRIEDTRWGYDGDCGVVAIANEGSDLIQAAMKGAE